MSSDNELKQNDHQGFFFKVEQEFSCCIIRTFFVIYLPPILLPEIPIHFCFDSNVNRFLLDAFNRDLTIAAILNNASLESSPEA